MQSAKTNAEHDFSLFHLDQRRQDAFAVAFCLNRSLSDLQSTATNNEVNQLSHVDQLLSGYHVKTPAK